jgi:uncharacterized coiled-coil DUF342 family protein
MKLAQALIIRADMQKKINQIRERMKQNAKVQENEKPAESIDELTSLYESVMTDLEILIKKINRTNAAVSFGDKKIIDAIAERDCLRGKINMYTELHAAATIKQDRFTRSEVKFIRCVDIIELQKKIDNLSKDFRKLDTELQEKNWTTELIE